MPSSPVLKSKSWKSTKWNNLKRSYPYEKPSMENGLITTPPIKSNKACTNQPDSSLFNGSPSDDRLLPSQCHLAQPQHESREKELAPKRDSPSDTSFEVSFSEDSLCRVSNQYDSFFVTQTKDKTVLSVSMSDESQDIQDSQPLKNRIKNRLSSCPSSSLYDKRKRNENTMKNNALELLTKEINSQPGFELGPFFGLPTRVAELFSKYRGITQLYEWQEECIKEGIKGGNLLISLPTSGGKTLVAEILLFRQLMIFEKNVLIILPYVTLVQEKVRGLSPFAIDLEFLVEEYAGSKGIFPPKKRRKNVVYIATIEKANILIDSFIEEGRLSELGLIVVDEVHMLGDTGGRGAKLEIALIKLRYLAKSAQIISMSATVGNVNELSSFLDARLYTGSFRPIPLTEYVKVSDQIAEINPKAKSEEELLISMRPYSYQISEKNLSPSDPDCIMGLISDIIPYHSCLVFCSTRRNAEAVALVIKSSLPKKFVLIHNEKKNALIRALKEEIGENSLCPVLRQTIPYGIAYHHSGLTEGERKLIEEGYQCNTLCCLVCTSTLAAGVNLPARRVIIRSPYVGREFLTRSRYQQMIGRAGRAGLDSKGESFIVTTQKDLSKVGELLLAPVEKCLSKLSENHCEGLSELIFSMLGLKVITSLEEAFSLVRFSLLFLQAKHLQLDVDKNVRHLLGKQYYRGFLCLKLSSTNDDKENSKTDCNVKCENNLFKMSSSQTEDNPNSLTKSLSISRLGKAAIKGGINLSLASRLYNDLLSARSHLALHSRLHLLYLVTPYTAHESLVFKAQVFNDIYKTLSKEELEVTKILGITEAIAVKLILGAPTKLDRSIIDRFYATLMLHQLLNGMNILAVSAKFDVHRGSIQQLLFSAASFASCINRFCQELDELWAFQDLFGGFSSKLSLYCSAELIPLMELPGVKTGRARLLYRAGYKTLTDIANAEAKAIVHAVDHLSYKLAHQIISSAKMLLLQKAEALQEEADDLLKGLGNDPEVSFLSSYQKMSS